MTWTFCVISRWGDAGISQILSGYFQAYGGVMAICLGTELICVGRSADKCGRLVGNELPQVSSVPESDPSSSVELN